ncbi:MAG: GNAT family N-acetyltransferase [Spirochaetota bacterium]|nr:GNAT family N-acetyltransferase [Spirochaetota bacterium]
MSFDVIHSLSQEQIEDLYSFYPYEWWTEGRELSKVKVMLDHSDELFAITDSEKNKLVAFARVLTDYVFKAIVLDLIVEKSYRQRGLGKMLMENILNHPNLRQVGNIELYCREDMIDFYEVFGFREMSKEICLLRRENS